MKRILLLLLVSLMLLLVLISCNEADKKDTSTDTDSQIIDTGTDNQQKKIEKITDFPNLTGLEQNAEKIEITYLAGGEYRQLTVTEEQSLSIIMKSIFESEIKNVGELIPPGADSFRLDIVSGGSEYVVSECMLYNGSYYEIFGNIDKALENALFPPNEYIVNGCQNSLNTTKIDTHKYYEPIKLGNYIGESVPSEENNGHDFREGLYYEAVWDYEKALTLFSDTSALSEKLFEDYYIFVIGMHIATGLPYDVYGFYDLYFDGDLGVAKISFDGKDGFGVTEACSVHNFYLKIPKSDHRYTWLDRSTGKLDWKFNTEEYFDYYATYKANTDYAINEGTAWLLTSKEEINEFGNYYGIPSLSNFKNESSYLLLVYMRVPCFNCLAGFKDLHIDTDSAYITVEKNEAECINASEYYFVGIKISKTAAPNKISPSPEVAVLIELNKIEYIK